MTQKLLLRATVLACAMLLGMTLQAQVVFQPYQVKKVYNPWGQFDTSVKFFSNSSFDKGQLQGLAEKSIVKAEGDLCTVTINLDYDAEEFEEPSIAFLIDSDGNTSYAYNNDEGALVGEVVPGIYDIVAYFDQGLTSYYVICELYEIISNTTLTVSPVQSINHITTKNYGPNGELLKHGFGHTDDNGQWCVDEEGSLRSTLVVNELWMKGKHCITSHGTTFIGIMDSEEMSSTPLDIYINDVSDRFVFIQQRICLANDISKSYLSYFSTDNVKVGVLENSPNDYRHYAYKYKYTPYGYSQAHYGVVDKILIATDGNTSHWSSGAILEEPKPNRVFEHEVWANLPSELGVMAQTDFLENVVVQTFSFDDEVFEFPIDGEWTLGHPFGAENGLTQFRNIGHHNTKGVTPYVTYNSLYNLINDNRIINKHLPSPEPFNYLTEFALGIMGDNCPINALKVEDYENDGQVNMNFTNYYVGRYGETVCVDKGINKETKFNGTVVHSESFAPDEKGVYEITVTNTNIEVDGLPGHNTTTVYFDQNQEDKTPPAVEMLHFKNADGGITDRFATAADGTMEFYASDFNYQYYPDLWNGVFDCQPVEVTVEYAPYGTEAWNELAVEEIPEYYQEPGWGYFYRGSLASVTGEGLNGWFDLRFRLQDESGNWMDQVVSPAFRIDDQAYSSVATVGSDNAREVARYNLAGQRVDDTHHGVTIVRMSDGTARKVIQ